MCANASTSCTCCARYPARFSPAGHQAHFFWLKMAVLGMLVAYLLSNARCFCFRSELIFILFLSYTFEVKSNVDAVLSSGVSDDYSVYMQVE